MKNILCISDIHIPTRIEEFPYDKVRKKIKDIPLDYVFGLGDYVTIDSLNKLYLFEKKVYAVYGNMDDEMVKCEIETKINLTIEDTNIGLIHGWGPPWDLRERIRREFDNVNLICFGHTHEKFFKEENGIYFLNPGAICGDKSGNNKSFAILTIDGKDIKVNFFDL